MTPAPTPIQCKSCARILATASPDGLVDGPPAEGCSTCAQFAALHDAVRAADEAYAPLRGKGDKHRGKQAALAEVARSRMVFGNYLMGVEGVGGKGGAEDQDGRVGTMGEDRQEELQSGRGGTPKEGQQEQHLDGSTTENRPSQHQKSQQLPHRQSSKRTHSITSVPERKRIKFDDSVEFRDDYRPYLELNRSNKDYVPGRYAPPEEGYLDTSGSEISALKFTGMKRVKGGWVEVIPREKRSRKGAWSMSSGSQELGPSEGATSQESDFISQGDIDRPKSSLLDPRAERLQRRTKRAPRTDAVESGCSLTGGKRDVIRRHTETSLNRAEDDITEPFRGTATETPQEGERHDLSLTARPGDVEESFTGMHPVLKVHDAPEGLFNLHAAIFQPSDVSSSNVASHQLHEDGGAQISSTFINTGHTEIEPPTTTTSVDISQPSSRVAASNKSSWKENHDDHPHIQDPSSRGRDVETRESREESNNEPVRVDNQEKEHVLGSSHQSFAKGVSEASLDEKIQQLPPSDISEAKRP